MPQTIDNMSAIWSNSLTTYTFLKTNITGPSGGAEQSAAGSLLMDLQVGGSSRFSVNKGGTVTIGAASVPLTFSGAAFPYVYTPNITLAVNSAANTYFYAAPSNVLIGTSGNLDVVLSRRAAANLRLGAADAAAPVAQTLSVQSGTAGASALSCSISGTTLTVGGAVTGTIAIGHAVTGTGVSAGTVITAGSGTTWTVNNSQTVSSTTMYFNSVGQNLTITGSQGSGPSAGGSIVFQVAPAGSAGTTAQNALATALTIGGDRNVTMWGNGSAFWFEAASGFEYFGSGTIGVRTAGARPQAWKVTGSGQSVLSSGAIFGWASGAAEATAIDTILARDNIGVLALRNGANAQTFRVYNTTDGTNGNWLELAGGAFSGVYPRIAGTGTNSGLIVAGSATGNSAPLYLRFQYNQNGWRIDTAGNLLAETDNTYDIGASGATRPRNIYAGSNLFVNGSVINGPSPGYIFVGGGTGPQIGVGYYGVAGAGGVRFASTQQLEWTNTNSAGSSDTTIIREAAGVVGVRGSSSTTGGALSFIEQTAPSAPATNGVRIYAEDNGSGKTRLMALFPTGAAVQIAIEP